jgi:hypothetical protein
MLRRTVVTLATRNLSSVLFSRISGWRTDFLWRFFGLTLYQLAILLLHDTDTIEKYLSFPIGFHLTLGCGVLLMVFGHRLILLLLTSISTSIFLIPWNREVVDRQVADEYILLMLLPTIGVFLTLLRLLHRWLQNREHFELDTALKSEIDTAHISFFRLSIVIAMFFAVLHKLNSDFFNPDVSCASVLAKELELWWRLPIPDTMLNAKPDQVILGEALVPTLLLLYPRLGILFATIFVGLIGHIGPTLFTMLMFMMACAFFRHEDGESILSGLKRYWSGLLTFALVISVISFKTFTGKRTWFEFHLYQLVIIGLIFCVFCILVADWKRYSWVRHPLLRSLVANLKTLITPRFNIDTLFPHNRAIRIALVSFAVLFFLNGMSPYFGLKYRYSFAMLSNLRVDTARWNSMVIPKWFYLRKHDPFIHVTRVNIDRYTQRRLSELEPKRQHEMRPGLISPMSFKHRLHILKRLNAKASLEFTYRGVSYAYEDVVNNAELENWLAEIPDSKMFQEWLPAEGPQPCVH